MELIDRLLDRTDVRANACWEWRGCLGSHGYGMMSVDDVRYCVHRLSYNAFRGDIPKGKFVCHTCDNRKCINPAHLFIGGAWDNAHDMIIKGRDDLRNRLKLTNEEVRKIRELRQSGMSQSKVAALTGTSQATVSRIMLGQSYWWV